MNTVIKVENLSKRYSIGASETSHDNIREVIVDLIKAPFRRFRSASGDSSSSDVDFWALNDVSFDVQEGDVMGIIGRNGAGKSTLLKILSKITEPTSGVVKIKGRIASLLEVGTGFHPELTGRENIFLNGAILGMTRGEINRKFDEIVDFSEIEKFLDTPVKRYSSGMYVRLAFAVAAHLEPEILVIDEVLAVGDAQFQKKCLGKMHDVSTQGKTILFVSHNMAAITNLCSKAILLNTGKIIQEGTTKDVINFYLDKNNGMYSPLKYLGLLTSYGEISLVSAFVEQSGSKTSVINCREAFDIIIEYTINKAINNARMFITFRNENGALLFSTSDYDDVVPENIERECGKYISKIAFPKNILKTGTIYGTVGADIMNERIVFAANDAIEAEVIEIGGNTLCERHTAREGVFAPLLKWETVSFDS